MTGGGNRGGPRPSEPYPGFNEQQQHLGQQQRAAVAAAAAASALSFQQGGGMMPMGPPMIPPHQVLAHGLPPPYFDPRGTVMPQPLHQQPQQLVSQNDTLRNRLRNPSTAGNNGHRHRPAPPGRRWRGGQSGCWQSLPNKT